MDLKSKTTETKKKDATKLSKGKADEEELIHERYAHYDTYVRHPYFVPGVKNVYHIRKSLAEYLKERLIFAPGVYYQRVFMFAKKTVNERGTQDEQIEKQLAADESEDESDYSALSTDLEMLSDYEEEEEEQEYMQEQFVKRLKKIKVKKPGKTSKETAYIEDKLIKLMKDTEKSNITNNKITGRFLSLGDDYAIFIFESSEDVIGNFLYNLHKIGNDIWSECRIFHVEDHIYHTFFDEFQTLQYPAIDAHEKLLPNLSEDKDFMARQHFDLKSRLSKVCEILSPKIPSHSDNTVTDLLEMSEDSHKKPLKDIIKMYLPEVQRIELILKCEQFYHSFKQFIRIYGIIPHQKDEDAYAWPLPTDYTPLGIFRRNEFDVNFTFGDYLQQDIAVEQSGSSDSQSSEH